MKIRHATAGLIAMLAGFAGPAAAALPERGFEPAFPGTEGVVNYEKYGEFKNAGTEIYTYEIKDPEGLSRAVGEGIYPNESVLKDPEFRSFKSSRKDINVWKYVGSRSPRDDFYAWSADRSQDPGVRAFFTAQALRKSGLIREAIKAYTALVVHFPKTAIWSADGRYYWYAAPEAIAWIRKLCATYPELGFTLEGALIDVTRGEGRNPKFDAVRVNPGRFEPALLERRDPDSLKIVEERGGRKVKLAKLENGHWRLFVDGRPFTVKGVTYTSTTVGESAHALNLRSWMKLDDNRNSKNDGMFDSWIDKNRNSRRDTGEPVVGDAALLRDLGVNAVRFYHGQDAWGNYVPEEYDKALMRTLARDYGIYFVMGDFLGAYTVGSGAAWGAGTDYTNPTQCARMQKAVRDMVLDHKDEPYVLFWLLGNENQHELTHTNAGSEPEAYARFVNETARMIKELDPDHPVATGNLGAEGVSAMARFAPDVDIYGANVYSGPEFMGSTVSTTKALYDRPLLFTEWGCDAYAERKGRDEAAQARYILGNWSDMELNSAGNTGEGNVIGGILFEWMDEWWKTTRSDGWGEPRRQNAEPDFPLPFPDGWAHEEWYGLMGQGDGRSSHFLRQPRLAYYELARVWKVADEPRPAKASSGASGVAYASD